MRVNSNLFKRFFDKDLMSIGSGKGKLSIFVLTVPIFLEGIAGQIMGMVQSIMAFRYMDGFFIIPTNTAKTLMAVFAYLRRISAVMSKSPLFRVGVFRWDYRIFSYNSRGWD